MPARITLPSLSGGLAALLLGASALQAQDPHGPCPHPVPVPTTAEGGSAGNPDGRPMPSWDLRCIELVPTARGGDARGVVTLTRPPSPFGVSVTPEGRHLHTLSLQVDGLPDPSTLGPYTTYVAWVTPLVLDPVVRLAEVRDGDVHLGTVDFSKYLVLVTAEASGEVEERTGPMVLRGRSPSSRMEAHDMLAQAPSAEQGPAGGRADHDAHVHGPGGAGGDEGAWRTPPGYSGVPMLPGVMALRPDVSPLVLQVPDALDPPPVRPREVVTLPDGGTLDLSAGFVRKQVGGRDMLMLAFNGQHPGPLIRVAAETTIFVNFLNETPFPTAVHWHGIRLDNAFDGVPGVTQDPVQPGETFQYRIHFPDAGIYWYHPHHREDVQQELGLYGNLLVEHLDAEAYGPVNREEVLMLDDLLLDDDGPVPLGEQAATHALMGRFGNVFLVNGEPEYRLEVRRGEVVRFHLTNAANTRTFNLSFQPAGDATGRRVGGAASAGNATAERVGGTPSARNATAERVGGTPSAGDATGRRVGGGTPSGDATGGRVGGAAPAGDPGGADPAVAEDPAGEPAGSPRVASPLPMKVVATDVGRFEREVRSDNVVLAPAERYVVDVRFPEAGTWTLVNHVLGINHRMGVFREERTELGTVEVADDPLPADDDLADAFAALRTHDDVVAEIDPYRDRFDDPVDLELVMALEADSLPLPIEQSMRYDWVYFNPVEWTGTMPMMNWAVSARTVRWILREPSTGRENMDIDWRFQVGDVVKIRVHNDRSSFHAMQHPLHIHGQRFLVLEQDGVENDNLAWKDTVLLPAGSTTDLLLEISNPGRWMVHCHIAEHLEAGMKFVFDVERAG